MSALSNAEYLENNFAACPVSKRCCFWGVCLIVLQEASPYIHAKSHYFSIIWHYIEVCRAYGSVQGAGLLILMSILSTSSPLHSETDDDEFWEISVSFSAPPWWGSGVGYQRAWDPGWVWVYVVCVHAFVAVFRSLLVIWKYLCRYLCIEWRVASLLHRNVMFMVALITHFMHCFFWVNEDMQRSCDVKGRLKMKGECMWCCSMCLWLCSLQVMFYRFLGPKEL